MIDTHSHLNFKSFGQDWREVVERAMNEGVEKIMVVGTDIETSRRAVEMAQQHPALYATVGIHPHHAKGVMGDSNIETRISKDLAQIELLIQQPKVVAVGEIGLDNHIYTKTKYSNGIKTASSMTSRNDGVNVEIAASQAPRNDVIEEEINPVQRQLFQAQLELAHTHHKPVIVHSRKVRREVLDVLVDFNQTHTPSLNGVFHCFEGSRKLAREILAEGFYVSFTGNITYAQGMDEVARVVPLDRLLLETDSPYMTPRLRSDYGGIAGPIAEADKRRLTPPLRCEPRHVKIIGQFHAFSRGITAVEVYEQTTKNAQKLFGL